jgi:arsenate reductase-like glutaredoxin family protein
VILYHNPKCSKSRQVLQMLQQLIAGMVANPSVIERSIVVNGARAALGRPPERVLEILDTGA